jgi:hypothetical protein
MGDRTIRARLTTLVSLAVAVFLQVAPAQAAMDWAPGSVADTPSGLPKSALNLVPRDRGYDFQVPRDAVESEWLRYEQIRMDEYGLNSAASPQPPVQLFPKVFWNQNQFIVQFK